MSGSEQNTSDTKKTNMKKNKNGFLKISIPGNLRTYISYRFVWIYVRKSQDKKFLKKNLKIKTFLKELFWRLPISIPCNLRT